MEPICRQSFEAGELMEAHRPRPMDRNKRLVLELCCPAGARHSGAVNFSRWRQQDLPAEITRIPARPVLRHEESFFSYGPEPEGEVHWHLNFAHHDLFVAYDGPLLAQDELQVAEHPILASLRHALLDAGVAPLTVEDGVATPVLITGVERRCAIATEPDADAGRPHGLYGNEFSSASEAAVRRATRVLDPPTRSNILAMEAPAHGSGTYSRSDVTFILASAITGYRAALQETRAAHGPEARTVIHTGYWGCGAYGGNRRLMPLLQLIAACAAGIDALVFHSGGEPSGYEHALARLEAWLPPGAKTDVESLLTRIEEARYEWGVGDGT